MVLFELTGHRIDELAPAAAQRPVRELGQARGSRVPVTSASSINLPESPNRSETTGPRA